MESLVINSVVIIACAVFFAWRGYKHGVIRNIKGFVGILAAYFACYFLAEFITDLVVQYAGWQRGVAYVVVTLFLFVSISFLVRYLLGMLTRQLKLHDVKPARAVGSLAGVVLGILLGLLTVWTGNIAYDAIRVRLNGAPDFAARRLDPVRQLASDMVGETVSYAVQYKADDNHLPPALTANLITDPVGMSQKITAMAKSESVKLFFADSSIQEMMQENRFDEIAHQPAFMEMMNEPLNKEVLTTLSLAIDKPADLTPEQSSARLLADIWQKRQRLLSDPRFVALMRNREYQALLANPSAPALLASPALGEIAKILFTDPSESSMPAGEATQALDGQSQSISIMDTTATEPEKMPAGDQVQTIYRWKDKNGRIHFSEDKPEGDYEVETTTLRY